MTNSRFNRTASINRFKATCFTILFHITLLGGLFYFSGEDASIEKLLPDVVKEWLDMGEEESLALPVKNKGKQA